MKRLILFLALAQVACAEGIPLTIIDRTTNSVTFMTRTAQPEWWLYSSGSIIYPRWSEEHHAVQTAEPKTWVFKWYRCNPLPYYQCQPTVFFHARTDKIPALAPPPTPTAPDGWMTIDPLP